MNDPLYHLLARLLNRVYWNGKLLGGENLPEQGPAIFIGNHLGALGPIGTVATIPLRLHPWIHKHMVDYEKAATYLNMDFVERRLKLRPPLSGIVSKGLSHITVPLLRSVGCIPVHRGYKNMQTTWEESLACLLDGKILLVFPEDESLGLNPQTNMAPFQKTIFRLGEMFYKQTGQKLAYYPVAIQESHSVKVGTPYWYNPSNSPSKERRRLKNLAEDAVIRMYRERE